MRIGDVEGVVLGLGRVDLPDDAKFDVGDILVAGKHQAFFGRLGSEPGAGCFGGGLPPACFFAEADIGDVAVGDRELDDGADRGGQIIVEAGLRLAAIFAEIRLRPISFGSDCVKAREQPGEQRSAERGWPTAAAKAARQHLFQPLLAAAQQFLEVRRLSAAARTLTPWPALLPPGIVVLVTWAALIAPGHFSRELFAVASGAAASPRYRCYRHWMASRQ